MEQNERAVGIDLGTTYSCIAHVDSYGQVTVIPNQEHGMTTPSVVFFEGDTVVVGEYAKNVSKSEPDDVVQLVKRAMGDADWRTEHGGNEYRPEGISALILRKLVSDAEESLRNYGDDTPIKKAVITCPAYFRIPEIEATRQAGYLAGLEVLGIIFEPVAAAIAYGASQPDQGDQRILVYDLGGGTFDATYVEISGTDIQSIATDGDHNLGGRNWDELIVDHLADQFQLENPATSDPRDNPQTLNSLFVEAENLKKQLSRREHYSAQVQHEGAMSAIDVTREDFDNLTAHLLEQTIAITNSLLAHVRDDLKHAHPQPDKILLVGGSTKMPQVAARIQQEFGMEPVLYDPDQSVAKGAALYAQMILKDSVPDPVPDPVPGVVPTGDESQNPETRRVIQSTSHSFGIVAWIEQPNGEELEMVSNLISLSTPLPATATGTYGTHEAHQTAVDIRIMENTLFGDLAPLEQSNQLGTAELPLPSGMPKGAPIEVTFVLDASGALNATAKDLTGGQVISVNIDIPSRMTEEELEEAKRAGLSLTVE